MANYREHGETVDVFLPSCGEPLAVLNNTFRYVSAMNWGGVKTVYVLDDSAGRKFVILPNSTTSGISSGPTPVR